MDSISYSRKAPRKFPPLHAAGQREEHDWGREVGWGDGASLIKSPGVPESSSWKPGKQDLKPDFTTYQLCPLSQAWNLYNVFRQEMSSFPISVLKWIYT